jgi:hypothetical protein
MARRNNFDPDEVLDPDDLEEQLQEEGNDGILRDGQSVRVALYMKDGSINPRFTATQRGKAASQQTEDAVARRFGLSDGLQLHKPGFRRVTDAAALERVQQAYANVDAAAANAWRSDASGSFRGQQAGDQCMINGAPGHLNDKLECVPDRRQDAATVDAKAAAYEAYDREMANAWRNPH